jgi:hypothetical protein
MFVDPPDSPKTRDMKALFDLEIEKREAQSQWNGYKLMSPNVQDAIRQADRNFPPNVEGIPAPSPQEHAQFFHESGQDGLAPGSLVVGVDNRVMLPEDAVLPTARVGVHQHPYTGLHASDIVSMSDQLIARSLPSVEHIVQIPAPAPGEANPYLIFSGAFPPRHYTLVENPSNLPVPPHSPDGNEVPPFHPHPGPA